VSNTDTAAVVVDAPGITIQKTPDTQTILVGGTASFTITVTNSGNVTLTLVSVADALAPDCVRSAAAFDALDSDTFEPGDIVTYNCTLTNVQANFTNSATATGTPPQGPPVSNTDTADVVVESPSIDVQKTPDSQSVAVGGTATFTITVTNTGNVTLTNVTVTDALAPGCSSVIGTMLPAAVVSYNCTLTNVQAGFTNTAAVTGTPPNGPPVTDTDTAVVSVQAPSIDVQKTPDSQTIGAGGTATFTITVTNTGDVTLTNVFVTDAQAPGCARTAAEFDALDPGTFDPGNVVSYSCTLTNVQAGFTNSATATGTAPGGNVSDTDTAVVVLSGAAISIDKSPNSQTLFVGGTATFTITVTNTGNVTLSNVFVTDAQAPGCARTAAQFDVLDPGTFDPGDVVSYSCTLTNVQSSFVNSATGTGTPPGLPPVTDTDTAVVNVGNIPPVVIVTVTPTPTSTVVPPTNTPTPVSTQAGARTPGPASPTPVSTQAGERTPGPGAPTPVAPSTGDGLMGGAAGGFNLALILGGLLALTTGLSFIALASRTRR